MYTFENVARWVSIVTAALVLFIGIPLANAATYTYNLSDVDGFITTTCDNCVLNSSNIVAWSMSVPGFSIASTQPGANLSVPAGDTDMAASPGAVSFDFTGSYYGFVFNGPLTVKNVGTAPLLISSIAIVGAQADDFALVNRCGSSLAVGQLCSLFVTFKPVAAGAKSAAVLITDNASGPQLNDTPGSQRSIALTGTATAVLAPALTLSATSLSFASQQVGSASTARAVNLTNTGTAPLSMSSIAIVGSQADDFALAKACGSSLPVGKSCALFVTFKPVAAGAKSAAIFIADNAKGSQRSVALVGTGL